ncbi:MAG: hypothetical protein WCL32_18365 [Planctomycetota bacterium]
MMIKEKSNRRFSAPTKWVKVQCKVSRSGFSSERVFRIENFKGVSHRDYILDDDDRSIGDDVPPEGEEADAYVAAQVLQYDGDEATISLPSGDVVAMPSSRLIALKV